MHASAGETTGGIEAVGATERLRTLPYFGQTTLGTLWRLDGMGNRPMQFLNRLRAQADVALLTGLIVGLLGIILWMIDAKLP